jgi:hypothetical protein
MDGREGTIVRNPNNPIAFILSGIDIGDAIVRDSSNRPLSMSGRACLSGPVSYLPAADKPEASGPALVINRSQRTKETS